VRNRRADFYWIAPWLLVRTSTGARSNDVIPVLCSVALIFARNSQRNFAQYTSERPADFAKATTAKERTEGQNNQQKENQK
jgi:hypothetical protein